MGRWPRTRSVSRAVTGPRARACRTNLQGRRKAARCLAPSRSASMAKRSGRRSGISIAPAAAVAGDNILTTGRIKMSTTNRRKFLGRGVAVAAAATAAAVPAAAQGEQKLTKRVLRRAGAPPPKAGVIPRFNSTVAYGNLVFIAGVGYHLEGDNKAHTEKVLESIKNQLEGVGSSMEKVLKVN